MKTRMKHLPPLSTMSMLASFFLCAAALWGNRIEVAIPWLAAALLQLQLVRDFARDAKRDEIASKPGRGVNCYECGHRIGTDCPNCGAIPVKLEDLP